jgi:YHS domain-containing protein
MESEVLNRKEVLQLLGTHAIGVRIDSDRDRALVSEYGVTTLPTEVIVLPDGKRAGRHVGAVGLTSYTSRLRKLGSQSDSQNDAIQVASHETEITDAQEVTRTCLIVKHDGEMVGMGGYSPVALTTRKEWVKGSEEFVVQHEGVDYFLESAAEAELFSENPTEYIPRMHGCDVVELSRENRALAGSIEFGSFYRGQVFFFANRENRSRFQSHPAWYVDAMTNGQTTNGEQFPFLQTASFD